LEAFEQAKLNVAKSNLADGVKLKQLDLLDEDKQKFEADGSRPRSAEMRLALQGFDEAVGKAKVAFSKAVDQVAKGYLDRKDVATYKAMLQEKQRFLDDESMLRVGGALAAKGTPVNLLELIDLKKDVVAGVWGLERDVLTIPHSPNALIQLPYEPGPEYDLRLKIERLTGDDLIAVGLVAGGNQCFALFDGWAGAGYRSGLQYIDGKLLIHNGTAKSGQCFPLKKLIELDISVRSDSIAAWVKAPRDKERREVFRYTGSQDQLGPGGEVTKNKKAMFLMALGSKVAVSSFEYIPVGTDAGRRTR